LTRRKVLSSKAYKDLKEDIKPFEGVEWPNHALKKIKNELALQETHS